jgi:5-methylthioadenosine/S-adenosylhomocysteine deaminase
MQRCDSLILADWCVPVEPAEVVLSDHAVAVTDGRITEILPTTEARARYEASAIIERPGHVLIPGLVNTHTHAAMTLFRGLADDLPLEKWLREGVWPAEKRWVDAELVRDGTRLAIAEMLRAGITCFSDQYFFPEIVAATAVDLHMRAIIGTPVIEFETAWARNASECLNKGAELVHDVYADHPLVSGAFAPHSTATVSDESFTELRVLADQLDAQVQIHLHESTGEIGEAIKSTGRRPLQRLTDLGLVNSSLMAVHAVHMLDVEIEQFADAGVPVAHCPRSNLKLADGIAPINAMHNAGVTVALGSDGAASNNVLDILGEMRTAALLAKAVSQDAGVIPAHSALRMATLSGAEVLGLASGIGSIETGKWADLTCIDLSALNSQPVYDPIAQIVYSAAASQVTDVWVAGRHQLDNGELSHINQPDLLLRTNEWQQRIASSR